MNHATAARAAVAVALLLPALSLAAPTFVNQITVAGGASDLSGLGPGANQSRLSIGSDLYYDRFSNSFFGLADRGPGGGSIAYETRVHQFTLNVDSVSGAISNFGLQRTVLFKDGANAFNGLTPAALNGAAAVLGRSFDPEGFAIGPRGTFFVSDEYGPTVREFDRNGQVIRTFTPPPNLLPRQGDGTLNFVDGRCSGGGTPPGNACLQTGRQDNRGFEGLTLSPDGTKLYAMLQDPLVNEGPTATEGRQSRHLRIVRYDVATGQADAQYVYSLDTVADINARITGGPGGGSDIGARTTFGANAQGRNIGISSITALNDTQFLVIERDNRGFGVDEAISPDGPLYVGSKRVYIIDLAGATDVSSIPLAGNTLPTGVVAVKKALFLDVQQALRQAGLTLTEKLEGLAIGPQLADGSWLFLLGTDNDFSVTQRNTGSSANPTPTQFDVCTAGRGGTTVEVALGAGCPTGTALIPSFLYAFKGDLRAGATFGDITLRAYVPPQSVPAPGTLALFAAGIAALGFAARRRRPGVAPVRIAIGSR